MNKVLGTCQILNTEIILFQWHTIEKQFGIARKILDSQDFSYLRKNFTWDIDIQRSMIFTNENQAMQFYNDYKKHMQEHVVLPFLIDKERLRFSFSCPKCKLKHISTIPANEGWEKSYQYVRTYCPQIHCPDYNIYIKLWNKVNNVKIPCSKIGEIKNLPNYTCDECNATGEYTLFTSVHPCSTCFPKK